jgi:hypothetical protein
MYALQRIPVIEKSEVKNEDENIRRVITSIRNTEYLNLSNLLLFLLLYSSN